MEIVYIRWGIYIAAVAVQIIYWSSMAPLAMSWRRVGIDASVTGEWMWIVGVSAVAMLAWPVFGLMVMADYDGPSLFSAILMTLGSWLLGWLASVAVKVMLGASMSGLDDHSAAKALRTISISVTLVSISLAVAAYVALIDFD